MVTAVAGRITVSSSKRELAKLAGNTLSMPRFALCLAWCAGVAEGLCSHVLELPFATSITQCCSVVLADRARDTGSACRHRSVRCEIPRCTVAAHGAAIYSTVLPISALITFIATTLW